MPDSDLAWRLRTLHHQIQTEAAAQKVLRVLREIRTRKLQEKYRPDQPRAPRGTPIGGQWIDDPQRVTKSRALSLQLQLTA